VSRRGTVPRSREGRSRVWQIVKRDRSEPHDGPVSGRIGIDGPRDRLSGGLEAVDGLAHRVADVEAAARAAHVALSVPSSVSVHLVAGIEITADQETLAQAERHRSVVRPFPLAQPEGTTSGHIGNRGKRPWRGKLHRRAQRVASCQAEEAPVIALAVPFRLNAPSGGSSRGKYPSQKAAGLANIRRCPRRAAANSSSLLVYFESRYESHAAGAAALWSDTPFRCW